MYHFPNFDDPWSIKRLTIIAIFLFSLAMAPAAQDLSKGALPGTLDTTFGDGGKVITPITGIDDVLQSVAIQADGKIVVAGYTLITPTNYDFAVVRYNNDGSLDPTFGNGGKVITPLSDSYDLAHAVVIQTNGKIVVAGRVQAGGNDHIALVRYNSDGTLDMTFGTGGQVGTAINIFDAGFALALQPDGKIVVAGVSLVQRFDFAVVRYNPNGSLDQTFGTGGTVTTPVGDSDDFAISVSVQRDGKLILAGYSFNGVGKDFAIVRYNANGSLDPTFGHGGKVITPIGNLDDCGQSAVIQNDGKIVQVGLIFNATAADFGVVRYDTDGSLDQTFGIGGKVITAVSKNMNDYAYWAAIQADGKIVVVGERRL